MVQPIDYRINVQSPFEAALGGFKIGADIAQMQQQREAEAIKLMQQQAAESRLKTYQDTLSKVISKPSSERTWEDFEPAFATAPNKEQIELLKTMQERGDATKLQSQKNFASNILLSLETNPNVTKNILDERISAEKDPQQKQFLQSVRQVVEESPQAAAQAIELGGAALYGKEWYEGITKVREERRKQEMQPLEIAAKKREGVPTSIQEAIDFKNLTPEQQKTFEYLQILKKPPAAVTNVNVSNVIDKAAGAELGKLVPQLHDQANAAASFLTDVPRYKKALDSAITGPLANERLAASRVSSALGFGGEKGIVATTEVIKALAKMTLDGRKTMRGEGAITASESQLAERAYSGNINLTKGELMSLFNASERAAKFQYTQSKKLLTSASSVSPTAALFLQNVVEPPRSESVNVGGQIYERPSSFTDAQWNAYKQSMGVK